MNEWEGRKLNSISCCNPLFSLWGKLLVCGFYAKLGVLQGKVTNSFFFNFCKGSTLTWPLYILWLEKQPCWIDQGKKLNRNSGRDQRAGADSIPACLADGTYAPVQCHKSAGYCWCVTPNGEMIPRTSVKHRRPECPKRGKFYFVL